MEGKVVGQVNDDGTVQFFFNTEHHLMSVLEGGPWSFKEWMVAMDRWTNRSNSSYLQEIFFWVQICNLPNEHPNVQMVLDIAGYLGRAGEVNIKEPTREEPAEVWVRITMDVNRKLTFARYLDLQDGAEPILLRFIYDKLRKFCKRCGSLRHDNSICNEIDVPPILPIVEFPGPVNHLSPEMHSEPMGEYIGNVEEDDYGELGEDATMHMVDEEQGQIEVSSEFNRILAADQQNTQDLPLVFRETGSSSKASKCKAQDSDVDDQSPTSKAKLQG